MRVIALERMGVHIFVIDSGIAFVTETMSIVNANPVIRAGSGICTVEVENDRSLREVREDYLSTKEGRIQ